MLFQLIFICIILQSIAELILPEYEALLALHQSAAGADWRWLNESQFGPSWNFTGGTDPCSPVSWQGVICNASTAECASLPCSVASLTLEDMNLNGEISTCLGNLQHLQTLSLSKNSIVGQLPRSLCHMSSLHFLLLHSNKISGAIPDCIGTNMTALEEMWLYSNKLEEGIPSSFEGLTSITYLSLGNNLLDGSIPSGIWKLTKLTNLQLYSNSFAGPISADVGNLLKLKRLYLFDNFFSQSIPASIGNLTDLIDLYIYQNLLTHTIPSALCDLGNVNAFAVMFNQLQGEIPECLLLPKATYIDVSANYLSGNIPSGFGNSVAAVNFLYLDDNLLTSTLPSSLAEISRLSVFFADNNQLEGSIPSFIAALTYLSVLDLSINKFHGSVPSFLVGFSRLKGLVFFSNQLTGTLPKGIAELSKTMELILLNNNRLRGSIPSELGSLTKLTSLQLQSNSFTGTLPSSFGSDEQPLPLLKQFYVGYNRLTGVLPLSFRHLGAGELESLSVRSNMLTGTIPNDLFANMKELTILELCNNRFSGTLPISLGALVSLQTLLLQSNAFIGTPTPAINASMSLLTTIDISDNLLTGNVPSILFEFKYISIIAAAKNCFKGTLPTSLCRPTALVSLILDGLSSGQSCIDRIPYTAAYWARRMVEGEIPACLLTNQPFLTLLHASGNFLSGKFLETDITNVTSKLVKLVVSHNRLSGSISESIQRRPLLQLDVSFNLITGTVEHFGADRYVSGEYQIDDNKTEYSTTIINLKENRLSGNLPSSFHYASDIDVLGGNLFSCDPETTPQNDPAAEEYICGSDDLDAALMAWGVLVIVVIIAYASLLGYTLLMGRGKQRWWATLCREGICTIRSHAQIIVEWYTASNVILQQAVDERLSSRVSNPSDGVMTDFDRDLGQNTLQFLDHLKTHRNSCVFISAIIAFIYGPLCIIIKSNLLPAAYGTYLKQMSWVYSALFQGGYISALVTLTTWCSLIVIYVASSFDLFKKEVVTEEGVAFVQSSNTAAAVPSGESSSILQRLLLSDVARFLFTLTFNCTIVLAVNLAYVYGMISDSTSYSMKIVLRLLLIMFNALWTNSSITMIYQVFPREMKRLGSHSAANVLLLLIPMFNTVFAPLISSALLDDSCFRRLLSGEDEITASYAYLKCTYSVFELFENGESSINCAKFEPTGIISTTFEASYNYSYSCSSSLMKVYLPVLMAGYLIKCCLVPMAYTILLLVGESNIPKSMLSKLPKIIFPSLDQVEENSSENYDDSVFIFDAIKVVAFMRNHLLVLLTFGFASPPLAISISVTAIAQTTFWQLLIGRYLQFSKNYEVSNVNKISFSGEVSFNDKSSSKATIVVNVVNMTPLHSSSIESQADIGIFDNIKDEDFHAKRVSQGMIWRSIRAVDSATARCCLAVMTWARLTLFSSLIFCGWIIIDISADAEGIEGSIWVFISIGAVYVLGNIGIYISGSTKKV